MAKSKSSGAAKADAKQKPEHKAEDVKRLQSLYKLHANKRLASGSKFPLIALVGGDLKAETSLLGCLLRLRMLLDKSKELSKLEEPCKLKYKEALFNAFSDAAKHYCGKPSSGPLSLSLAAACATAVELLQEAFAADSTCEKQSADLLGTIFSACLVQAGYSPEASFSKSALARAFYDPRSENLSEEEVKGSASEQLVLQLGILAKVYSRLPAIQPKPSLDCGVLVQTPWWKEFNALKKEVHAKLNTNQSEQQQQQQQQQQRRQHDKASLKTQMEAQAVKRDASRADGRGADGERTRDLKRGRILPTDKPDEQQEQLMKLQEALRKEADSVVAFLESKLKDLAGEGFLQELQSITKLDAGDLLKPLNAPAPPVISLPAGATSLAQAVCQQAKTQLQALPGSDMAVKVKNQLQQLLKNDSWQLFSFEEPSGAGNSSSKLVTFSSRQEFEHAVREKHLLGGAAEEMTRKLVVQKTSPSLVDAFDLTEEMQFVLDDDAGNRLMQGSRDAQENPWVQVFKQECPLQKYVRTVAALPTQDTYIPNQPGLDPEIQDRISAALGFSLLQWERGVVSCERLQLSGKPYWVVLCFNLLKLLIPCAGGTPDQLDFITYNYLVNKASRQLHRAIRHPVAEHCSVDSGEESISMSDGLLQDNLTMLTMLQAGGLLSGPSLLALQLYLVRHTGSPAKLGKPGKGQAAKGDAHHSLWQTKLEELQEPQQVSLRCFLLKLLSESFAMLPAFDSYLQHYIQQYQQPELVPLQPRASEKAAGSKGRDKKEEEVELLLSTAYYEQTCFSAAKPHDQNYPCCFKHTNLRMQAEADGKSYNPYDKQLPEDDFGCIGPEVLQVDQQMMQRYLIENAAVVQAREQQGILSDSRAGLEALVNDLYDLNHMTKHLALFSSPAADTSSLLDQSCWDKARFDLLVATQLAMHRRQLYALVKEQTAWLEDQDKHVSENVARDRVRALLCQRVAGEAWLHGQWRRIFEQEHERLAGEKEKASKELREKEQAQFDKPSGGKATLNKEAVKEKAQAAKQKFQEIQAKLAQLDLCTSTARKCLCEVSNEADSFPDLIRASYGTKALRSRGSALEPLKEAVILMINETLDVNQPTSAELMARLSDALQLTRMKLFELDVWARHSTLSARKRVLVHMWQAKQPVAVVLVSKEALKQKLNEGIRLTTEAELLADSAFVEQQAQPSKTSKSKKKKKGPAAQPKKFIKVSDDEEEEEAAAAAAAAAAAKAAAEEAAEDSEPEQQQADDAADEQGQVVEDDDTWSSFAQVDMSTLEYSGPKVGLQQQQQQQPPPAAGGWESSSKSSSSRAPSSTRPVAGTGTKPATPSQASAAASNSSSSSATRVAAAAASGADRAKSSERKYKFYSPFCMRCYFSGHLEKQCPFPAPCSKCHEWGHSAEDCSKGARRGHGHQHNRGSTFYCNFCQRQGHKQFTCPDQQCSRCNLYGHTDRECREIYCRHCQKAGHVSEQCTVPRCKVCDKQGHVPGSPECEGPAEHHRLADSRSGNNSRQRRAPAAAAAAATTSKAAAAAAPRPTAAGVRLVPAEIALAEDFEGRKAALFNSLLDCRDLEQYTAALMADDMEWKVHLLMRIPADSLNEALRTPLEPPEVWLEKLVNHNVGNRHRLQLLPRQLDEAEAADLDNQLKDTSVARLAGNWREAVSWELIYERVKKSNARLDEFTRPVDRICLRALQRRKAEKEQKALSKSVREQGRQYSDASSAAAAAAAAGTRGSSSLTTRSSSQTSGTGSVPPAAQGAAAADPSTVPAADRPASVSFAQMAQQNLHVSQQQQQQQQQPPEGSGGYAVPPPGLYGGPPPTSYGAAPGSAAGAGAASWPTSAAEQQQLPVRELGPEVLGALDVDQMEDLRQQIGWLPAMLHYRAGMQAAIDGLVDDEGLRKELRAAAKAPSEAEMVKQVMSYMTAYASQLTRGEITLPEEQTEKVICFSDLLVQADKTFGRQPAPVAAPAAVSLPPHLQYPAQYQQQQHPPHQQQQLLLPPHHMPFPPQGPGMAALPPHLQQHGPPHLQQPPMHPQQHMYQHTGDFTAPSAAAAAAAVPQADNSESDEEDLLATLTGGQQQQHYALQMTQQQPAWGSAAGYDPTPADLPSLSAADLGSAAKRAAPAVSAAGLANEAGEYNCFLNVVVQCLWSCKAFREQVIQLPEHERGHPVVAALLRLFGQMQEAERGWQPGHDRVVVNPSELREALDQRTQFRRQEMNDANELLDTLYECFKQAQAPSQYPNGRGILVDSVFGLLLREEVRCPHCSIVSHLVSSHFEHMMVVNSMALTMVASDYPQGADMGTLLRLLQDQDQKSCDKDIGGCGGILTPTRFLEHPPQVLTIQLAWYQDVSGEEIGEALQHVQERVDVQNVYPDCDSAATTYQISSTVAYYGQHYMAFVHNSKLNTWLLFDDASVSAVGSWQDVIRKCVNGKIQPSVMFYQQLDITQLPDVHHQAVSSSSSSSNRAAGRPAAAPAVHVPTTGNVPAHVGASPAPQPAAGAAHGRPQPSSNLAATSNWGDLHRATSAAAAATAAAPQPAAAAAAAQSDGSRNWEQSPSGSSGSTGTAWDTPPPAAAAADRQAAVTGPGRPHGPPNMFSRAVQQAAKSAGRPAGPGSGSARGGPDRHSGPGMRGSGAAAGGPAGHGHTTGPGSADSRGRGRSS